MDRAFESQIGQNTEVYVDDLVTKSYTEDEMMRDIKDTVRTLRNVNMKLNLKKCSFGLAEGMFLGYVVTSEGIKPCPDKTAAVLQLPSPWIIKECGPDDRKRNGPNANLLYKPRVTGSRTKLHSDGKTGFVTSLQKDFDGEHNITYKPRTSVKGQILADFLIEMSGEDPQAVPAVETQKEPWMLFKDGSSSSNNESEYEALVAGLRIVARIGVKNVHVSVNSKLVANQVLGTYVAKEDNMVKYLEIVKSLVSGFTTFSIIQEVATVIEEDRPTWMTQLMDYLKEGVLPGDKKEARKLRLKARQYELMEGVLYRRSFLTPWLRCVGPLQVEYVMREIREGSCSMHTGPRRTREGQIFNSHHGLLHEMDRSKGSGNNYGQTGLILTNPDGVEFTYALRFQFAASNNEAKYEALIAGLRIATQMGVKNIQANVDSRLVANQVLGTYIAKEDNMIKYLDIAKGLVSGFKTFSICQVPRSKNKKADALSKIASTSFAHLSKQLRLKARQYELMEGILYKRSFLKPWLRCVGPLQAEYVMREIHEGSCSMHAGLRSVVAKAIRLGYFWPTMHKDAQDMIRKCSDCQGINIAGPFPEGPRKVKFLIVAMDNFTKWIEAKAVATITGGQVKKFVWDNIVCRFGIPGEIISDNGKQFADNPFKDWCDKLNIRQHFASVKHPQSNGLVEKANKSLGEGIKARLGEENKNWVKELPHIGMPTYRTAVVDVVNNDEELRLNLDLLEERRELAAMSEASNDASHAVAGGKLGPKWEGPYEVTDALGNGAYKLRSMDGTTLPRTWNVTNLKRCYL
nr:reverse transcriptase domain-containing protein [Tanacetum cinerariifolium]